MAAPLQFPDLSLAVVKLLGAGEYVLKRPGQPAEGHFGLAVTDYTHATAPNRRFPDVLTQRLLKAALGGRPAPYSEDELRALAAHCSEQERNADKVERSVRKSAAAMLLTPHLGEQFDAVVTGASEKGTWVRIMSPLAEGRVVQGLRGPGRRRHGARAAAAHGRATRLHRLCARAQLTHLSRGDTAAGTPWP